MKYSVLAFFLAIVAIEARVEIDSFGPVLPQTVETRVESASEFLTGASAADKLDIALAFAVKHVNIGSGFGFNVKDNYLSKDSKITHVYLKQTFQGVEIVNGDFNVNVDEFGRVLSFGNSFFAGPAPSTDVYDQMVMKSELSAVEAVKKFAEFIKTDSLLTLSKLQQLATVGESNFISGPTVTVKNVPFVAGSEVPMTRKYIIVTEPAYALLPVWDAAFDMIDGDNFFNAQIDVQSGKVVQMIDWVRQANFYVYPFGINDPSDGDMALLNNPEDKDASPLGWNNQGDDKIWQTTVGNNVFAQANPDGRNSYLNNFRPSATGADDDMTFSSPIDLKKEPRTYLNGSIINLFYLNNMIHDVMHAYGFDEVSGNFQEDNFKRGGADGDAVIANAQDGSGMNNANFMTPPDGQKPRMRMYTWSQTRPNRDGDLEAGIVIHEYAHGISNRLTGGPSNVNCLGYGESGGMGEGWGDLLSVVIRLKAEYTHDQVFGMGVYSAARGIRPFPYAVSLQTNPQTYSFITKSGYSGVHAIGSVWASILYNVMWNIIDAHGFDANLYAIKNLKTNAHADLAGNVMFMKLVIEGMKLQPCRPNFIDARNAIIKADDTLFSGKNFCLLWKGFAVRGLGSDAVKGGVDGFAVPAECQ